MALIKTPQEIIKLQRGGKILAKVLKALARAVRPGISTMDLETIAQDLIKQSGAAPAFPGYRIGAGVPPFPAALCTSIDHEIVHGIPHKARMLEAGQIIGLDLGVVYEGLYTDAAITVAVGRINKENEQLVATTKKALAEGIKQVKPGAHIGDISSAIQKVAESRGYGVVRDLVGHGVGHAIHEKPYVPNYGKPGTLEKLQVGMVIAIEPMFTLGGHEIIFSDDGWTVTTADGSIAAHFEHTVAVTEKGHIILTE